MNKAILVIDMPEDCNKCPLAVETIHNYDACCITGSRIISYGKFPWCPLKPLPSRWLHPSHHEDDYGDGYADGYNDCIDEILGE